MMYATHLITVLLLSTVVHATQDSIVMDLTNAWVTKCGLKTTFINGNGNTGRLTLDYFNLNGSNTYYDMWKGLKTSNAVNRGAFNGSFFEYIIEEKDSTRRQSPKTLKFRSQQRRDDLKTRCDAMETLKANVQAGADGSTQGYEHTAKTISYARIPLANDANITHNIIQFQTRQIAGVRILEANVKKIVAGVKTVVGNYIVCPRLRIKDTTNVHTIEFAAFKRDALKIRRWIEQENGRRTISL